jgi:GntR family transcriptional regulator
VTIDREGVRAPYLQLADILRERIASGEIPPGRRIPSQHELVAEFDLSRNTIRKALDVLKGEGLLETAPGRGLFVKTAPAE